jgi:hypothetical protein
MGTLVPIVKILRILFCASAAGRAGGPAVRRKACHIGRGPRTGPRSSGAALRRQEHTMARTSAAIPWNAGS